MNCKSFPLSLLLLLLTGTVHAQSFVELQKVIASDPMSEARFGNAVSMSGDWAIIGAPRDGTGGAAYMFQRDGDSWVERQKITSANTQADDFFGESVSISDDWAIVGAPGADSAYFFQLDGNMWIERQAIAGSNTVANDKFGESVSISAARAVIGARDHSAGTYTNSGGAYIFRLVGGIWTEERVLVAMDTTASARFGFSVSISEVHHIVVGAPLHSEMGQITGSAYVFFQQGFSWQQQKILSNDLESDDFFGGEVSMSGTRALIGAPGNDDNGTNSGSAYIFDQNGAVWEQQQKIIAGDASLGDRFGTSVSIDGDLITVGASVNDDNGDDSGSAYVYQWNGSMWIEQQKILASDAASEDYFGIAVTTSSNDILVGAVGNTDAGSLTGSAYFFGLRSDSQPIPTLSEWGLILLFLSILSVSIVAIQSHLIVTAEN